jgi:4-hydroxybenzoate polyprenyltransferase
MILIPSWLMLFLGYYRSSGPINRFYPSLRLVDSFFAFSLVMAAAYILNQIYDLESDRQNDKVFFLPRGILSVPAARLEAAILVLASFVLSYFQSRQYFAAILAALLLGIFYSLPPIKLKARPILDLLANSFGYGLVGFSLGWITVGSFSTLIIYRAVPYICAIGAVFVNTAIPDIPGDKRTGNITTAVLLGKKVSYFLALGLLVASIAAGFLLKDAAVIVASLLSLPFFILAAIKQTEKFCLLSTHFGIIALALVTTFFFPYFLIFLVLVIFATRFYYKRRFGIAYPAISF